MRLYLAPGACSLADHIALIEAGLSFQQVKVDLKSKRMEDGGDYLQVNPKGYVPALQLDDGQILTENIAILSWVADHAPALAPGGDLGRYRILEMLAFISSEIHKGFKPFFTPGAGGDQKAQSREQIGKRLQFLADRMGGEHLLGADFSVADAYLYVMLRWAKGQDIAAPPPLPGYFDRMSARPAVRKALEEEGLS